MTWVLFWAWIHHYPSGRWIAFASFVLPNEINERMGNCMRHFLVDSFKEIQKSSWVGLNHFKSKRLNTNYWLSIRMLGRFPLASVVQVILNWNEMMILILCMRRSGFNAIKLLREDYPITENLFRVCFYGTIQSFFSTIFNKLQSTSAVFISAVSSVKYFKLSSNFIKRFFTSAMIF